MKYKRLIILFVVLQVSLLTSFCRHLPRLRQQSPITFYHPWCPSPDLFDLEMWHPELLRVFQGLLAHMHQDGSAFCFFTQQQPLLLHSLLAVVLMHALPWFMDRLLFSNGLQAPQGKAIVLFIFLLPQGREGVKLNGQGHAPSIIMVTIIRLPNSDWALTISLSLSTLHKSSHHFLSTAVEIDGSYYYPHFTEKEPEAQTD